MRICFQRVWVLCKMYSFYPEDTPPIVQSDESVALVKNLEKSIDFCENIIIIIIVRLIKQPNTNNKNILKGR